MHVLDHAALAEFREALGADTDEVLGELLGLTPAAVAELRAEGVV